MAQHNLSVQDELIITRTFKAPKNLAFKAWKDAESLEQWWGPSGLTLEVLALDFKSNGIFHYCFNAPDGLKMCGKFVFKEIVPNEKIVFINSFVDENGNVIRAPFNSNWPMEIENTLLLEEVEGNTVLTLHGTPIHCNNDELMEFNYNLDNMELGFEATFNRLEDYLLKN